MFSFAANKLDDGWKQLPNATLVRCRHGYDFHQVNLSVSVPEPQLFLFLEESCFFVDLGSQQYLFLSFRTFY
jgi:hypothetical protein